jgi:hypothetical protein
MNTIFQQDMQIYLVMEYCREGTFANAIEEKARHRGHFHELVCSRHDNALASPLLHFSLWT